MIWGQYDFSLVDLGSFGYNMVVIVKNNCASNIMERFVIYGGETTLLLRYIVSNFKSIGHPIEFSMLPSPKDTDERFFTTIKTKAGNWNVLRRGGFWGPNASGKTSFMESLEFARQFILSGKKAGKNIGINQFRGKLDDSAGLSTFQFLFYQKGEVYDYGFSVNRFQVCEEWLMVLTTKDFAPMFTRTTDASGKTTIEIGTKFSKKGSKQRILAETLAEGMQEKQKNQLFLYKLYDNGVKRVEEIIDWFTGLQIIFPSTKLQGLPIKMQTDQDFKTFIADSLKALDTGIFDVSVASNEINFYEYAEKLNLPQNIVEEIEEIGNGSATLNGKYFIFFEDEKKHTILMQIKFDHHLSGIPQKFDIDDESDGTKRLLDLLPILFLTKQDNNQIFFIDEIDRSLHTKLSKYLLNKFISNHTNPYNQIIFTAHDVNLINLDELRQDEIWFVEKNNSGESSIRPFSDFNVREGQDTLKAYLNGRFGAIPRIKEEF